MNKIVAHTIEQIKSVKIQGATRIALAVAKALKSLSRDSATKTRSEFINEVKEAGAYLANARLTEPMADNAVEFIVYQLKKNKDASVDELKKTLNEAIDYFFSLNEKNEQKMIRAGEQLIKFGDRIFTHCHSTSVIDVLLAAKKNKKRCEVFQTETRPLYQGHLTARELIKHGIKNTLVVDSAASYLISKISGPRFQIDKVLIGCDAISRDGSCVNKVGSFGLALAAYLNKIPVYVVTPSLKINEDVKNARALKIEQREAREVWDAAPRGLKIYNPAFDLVPAEMITGYACEFGVVKPVDLMKKVKDNYPWLF